VQRKIKLAKKGGRKSGRRLTAFARLLSYAFLVKLHSKTGPGLSMRIKVTGTGARLRGSPAISNPEGLSGRDASKEQQVPSSLTHYLSDHPEIVQREANFPRKPLSVKRCVRNSVLQGDLLEIYERLRTHKTCFICFFEISRGIW
jgi:hypothetical protein